MKDLIKLYDEYLKFIHEQEREPATIAFVHGWRCPDDVYQKGIEYRKRISELKLKYGITENKTEDVS